MLLRITSYYVRTAYYRMIEFFGGPVVLLSDPRWKQENVPLEDLKF